METLVTPIKKHSLNFSKNFFEKSHWKLQKTVVGVDEVGRGCLAGPLVTGAVILPIGKTSPLLKDSKIMTHEERLEAYAWIIRHCHYQIGIAPHRCIDTHNIWQTTLITMKKAVLHLLSTIPFKPGAIVVDAMPLNLTSTAGASIPLYYFTKGEQKSSSIAAASIVAKVTRDALMQEYDVLFPGYHLGQHKGYSTERHQQDIGQLGHSIIHRLSFLQPHGQEDINHGYTQKSLC